MLHLMYIVPFSVLKVNAFFDIPLKTFKGVVTVGDTPLVCNSEVVKTTKVIDGEVG